MKGSSVPWKVDSLGVRLGGRTVLEDVSVEVHEGEFLAIVGPNGSGKTTLLRASLGLVPVARGSAFLHGRAVSGLSSRSRALRAAWMPQDEPPSENISVLDFVALGRYPHQGSWGAETDEDREAVRTAIERAGLSALSSKGILEISGGERQRALYGRALAQASPLLLLDEPTSHLDISYQLQILERLSEFRRESPGRAVVASLHDLNLACRFADRILWLSKGRVAAIGPPSETVTPERIYTVFGVEAEVHRRDGQVYVFPSRQVRSPPATAPGRLRVHVVCGGGSGGELLRALSSAGHSVSAGALNLLDSDEATCSELHLSMAVEAPFSRLTEETRMENRRLMEASDVTVVAPLCVGTANLANFEDARQQCGRRPVFLIGGVPGPTRDFTAGQAAKLCREMIEAGARELAGPKELLAILPTVVSMSNST